MTETHCSCGSTKNGMDCPACRERRELPYWCESCRQAVTEKRCPLCGLKAKRIREKQTEVP